MQISEYVASLNDAGDRLLDAAGRAGMDTAVPTCPGWSVRDLIFHTGAVHRWSASYLVHGHRKPVPPPEPGADPHGDAPSRPADDELPGWFRSGLAALTEAINAAPDDLDCWSFLPAPTPRAFWARRQTHETTMHGVDVELAAGGVPDVDPALATDGIDELLLGFVARPKSRLRADEPRTLLVSTTDTGAHWHLTISAEPAMVERLRRDADTTITGQAATVYLALWNRHPLDAVDVDGDTEVVRNWADLVRVRWR